MISPTQFRCFDRKKYSRKGNKGLYLNELIVILLLLLKENGFIPYAADQDLFSVNVRRLSILPVGVSAKEGT